MKEETEGPARHVDTMRNLTEEQLAELIAFLPPAPKGWVEAASELPSVSAAIEGIVARCLTERKQRQATLEDLETILRQAGVEPRRQVVERLRDRLA